MDLQAFYEQIKMMLTNGQEVSFWERMFAYFYQAFIEADRWSAFFQWLNDNNLVEQPLDVNAGWTMDYLEA